MLFRALYDLYQRLENNPDYDVAPPGRSHQKVTFVVVLDEDGSLVAIQDARQPVDGRLMPRRVLVPGGTKPSGSGLNPCFLWDNPAYLLGFDPAKPGRAVREFESFRDRHVSLRSQIPYEGYGAVCRFLEAWSPESCVSYPILAEVSSGFGVFQIRGETGYVHEHPAIATWWDQKFEAAGSGPIGQCLITGKMAPIARLHPKLKAVSGSQPSGATIAGFNQKAYESYGWTQSFNAPVSEEAAHRYATALNALLDGPRRDKHRLVVGGTTVVFWTDKPSPVEDVFAAFAARGSSALIADEAQDETVRAKLEAFVRALRQGREVYSELDRDSDSTGYFILGLAAPTPARIAVRFFHQGRLAELLDNLRRHYSDIGIERQFGEDSRRPEPEFPPASLLLDQTCPRKAGKPDRERIPPVLAGPMLEAIVTGGRYPDGLYAAVMRRITADREVNYPRACVIKGYLVRNLRREVNVNLDTSRADPAYRLGRLFAVLEKTQQDALGNVGATVRDRFYSSASATPASVFPRLLRTYQHHLAKLEGGRKVNRERLVQEVVAPLVDIPAHLGLADQGLFALGYYHQMNSFFTKKAEQSEN